MNKHSNHRNWIPLLILLGFTLIWAGTRDPFPYYRMHVGARALGMGGAHTAAVNGVEATYFNPAMLAFQEGFELNSMISSGMAFDRSLNFIGFGAEVWEDSKRGIAVSLLNAQMDKMPGYDESNVPTDDFNTVYNNVMLGYAEPFFIDHTYWGATVKLYHSSIDGDDESGYGFDVGGIYRTKTSPWCDKIRDIRLGVAVQDLFSDVDEDRITPRLKLGTAGTFINDLHTALDLGMDIGDDAEFTWAIGAEYDIYILDEEEPVRSLSDIQLYTIKPRLGLKEGNIHLGFGMDLGLIQIDYAFVPAPNTEYDDSHRFSFILSFDR